MDQITLNNVEHLHKIFRRYRSYNGFGYWFRGQANLNWSLLPKAGRADFYLGKNKDLGRLYDWKNQAIAYTELPDNEFECIAIAQHHGLSTRLLDWTQNPLVATYFAVNAENDIDGSIYMLDCPEVFVSDKTKFNMIKEYKGVLAYIPRSISP